MRLVVAETKEWPTIHPSPWDEPEREASLDLRVNRGREASADHRDRSANPDRKVIQAAPVRTATAARPAHKASRVRTASAVTSDHGVQLARKARPGLPDRLGRKALPDRPVLQVSFPRSIRSCRGCI